MSAPAGRGESVLGFLGLGVVLLGLVIGFVVAVEYDPEAARFRAGANSDFGLVTQFMSRQDKGLILGTPSYMPPEQISDSAGTTEAGDVYSLGATLYHLLTARPPFQASHTLSTMRQVIYEDPAAPSRLNAEAARRLSGSIGNARNAPADATRIALQRARDSATLSRLVEKKNAARRSNVSGSPTASDTITTSRS